MNNFKLQNIIQIVKEISRKTGKSFIHTFLDFFRCLIKYGTNFMNYCLKKFENMDDIPMSFDCLKESFDEGNDIKKDKKTFGKGHSAPKFFFITFIGIVIDFLLSYIGLTSSATFIFVVCYIFFYKHIDTRTFKKTCIYILILVSIIFIYDYVIDNYLDINNFDNPTLFYLIQKAPLDVLKIFALTTIETSIISILAMYFLFPAIDRFTESLNRVVGVILTAIIITAVVLFVSIVIATYLAFILLLLEF